MWWIIEILNYSMLKLSICLADQIRENIRDSVANFLYCLSTFSRCRDSVFVDILSRYRLRAEGGRRVKNALFNFSVCYRAGRDEPNAKNGRLIWLSLLEISRHKGWGLHAIVKEAWSLNLLISGRFFQLRRHFLKNWQGAMAWNLVGVFLGHSSRNLM